MLIQMVQTYVARPDRLADLADAVLEYEKLLATAGYIGRRRRSLYTDPPAQRVMLSGILQHPDAAGDMARNPVPEVADQFIKVQKIAASGPVVETYDAANTRDEHYCMHARWKEIVLICDPIEGHSALRCNECGGIVAAYRLGLSAETRNQLFRWEAQYDRIHGLWVLSKEYETWAEQEISRIDSPITRLGLELTRRMSQESGMRILYYLHMMKEEGLDRQCPACGQKLHEAIGTIWNLSCRECTLVVGRG